MVKKENMEKIVMLIILITAVFILALGIAKCENPAVQKSSPESIEQLTSAGAVYLTKIAAHGG